MDWHWLYFDNCGNRRLAAKGNLRIRTCQTSAKVLLCHQLSAESGHVPSVSGSGSIPELEAQVYPICIRIERQWGSLGNMGSVRLGLIPLTAQRYYDYLPKEECASLPPYLVDILKLTVIVLGVCVYTIAGPVALCLSMLCGTDFYAMCT